MSEGQVRAQVGAESAFFIGSPETVAKKIVRVVKGLDLDRFDFKYANGPMEHGKLMKSLELYGTKVVPLVKSMLHDGV